MNCAPAVSVVTGRRARDRLRRPAASSLFSDVHMWPQSPRGPLRWCVVEPGSAAVSPPPPLCPLSPAGAGGRLRAAKFHPPSLPPAAAAAAGGLSLAAAAFEVGRQRITCARAHRRGGSKRAALARCQPSTPYNLAARRQRAGPAAAQPSASVGLCSGRAGVPCAGVTGAGAAASSCGCSRADAFEESRRRTAAQLHSYSYSVTARGNMGNTALNVTCNRSLGDIYVLVRN